MGRLKELQVYSDEMIKVFTDNMKTYAVKGGEAEEGPVESYVTDEALSQLADIFNTVPIEQRAGVYSLFLDGLTDSGIFYDPAQFMGTRH